MVHPEYHRKGIGSILLKYRLRNLFNAGATRITLDTSPESCGFFMRHGFNACAITPNGIAPGRDRVSMVLLNQSTSP
jgi:ribosomal protein S18 acetylase RimI-like enzyme